MSHKATSSWNRNPSIITIKATKLNIAVWTPEFDRRVLPRFSTRSSASSGCEKDGERRGRHSSTHRRPDKLYKSNVGTDSRIIGPFDKREADDAGQRVPWLLIDIRGVWGLRREESCPE